MADNLDQATENQDQTTETTGNEGSQVNEGTQTTETQADARETTEQAFS